MRRLLRPLGGLGLSYGLLVRAVHAYWPRPSGRVQCRACDHQA